MFPITVTSEQVEAAEKEVDAAWQRAKHSGFAEDIEKAIKLGQYCKILRERYQRQVEEAERCSALTAKIAAGDLGEESFEDYDRWRREQIAIRRENRLET